MRKRIDKSGYGKRIICNPEIELKPVKPENRFELISTEFEMKLGRKPVNNAELYNFIDLYKELMNTSI